VCAAVVLALATFTFARAELRPGDAFPSLNEAGLSGNLPDVRGQVVLVDFWASWCAPCKESFPSFARLHQEFGGRGFLIVAVSVDEKPAAYAAFIEKHRPPFATVLDTRHQLVSAVKVPAMPTSYLLGRDGRVRMVHQGFHGRATEDELRREITALLAEQSTSSP
jgi:peroxiredoxin